MTAKWPIMRREPIYWHFDKLDHFMQSEEVVCNCEMGQLLQIFEIILSEMSFEDYIQDPYNKQTHPLFL